MDIIKILLLVCLIQIIIFILLKFLNKKKLKKIRCNVYLLPILGVYNEQIAMGLFILNILLLVLNLFELVSLLSTKNNNLVLKEDTNIVLKEEPLVLKEEPLVLKEDHNIVLKEDPNLVLKEDKEVNCVVLEDEPNYIVIPEDPNNYVIILEEEYNKIHGINKENYIVLPQSKLESILLTDSQLKELDNKLDSIVLTKEQIKALDDQLEKIVLTEEQLKEYDNYEHSNVVCIDDIEDDYAEAKLNESGKMILVRYKKSYKARLNLSDDEIKDLYSLLKNKLLSYKKVKSRISWNYESFNLGRQQAAKISIRGKSLFIYLPLEPTDFEDTKYSFKDCSDIKKYEQVPLRVKIKSNRSLKYAFELIELVMDNLEASLIKDYEEINYYEKNRGFNKLLEEGLIKEVIDEDTFNDLTEINKEFLDNNNIKSIDLETVKKLKFNVDTIKVNKKSSNGKKEVINIDTLSNHFNDGDVININLLKEHKLISKNTKSVKCLARGILNKKLTLDLQDYSSDAVKMIVITGGKIL